MKPVNFRIREFVPEIGIFYFKDKENEIGFNYRKYGIKTIQIHWKCTSLLNPKKHAYMSVIQLLCFTIEKNICLTDILSFHL